MIRVKDKGGDVDETVTLVDIELLAGYSFLIFPFNFH